MKAKQLELIQKQHKGYLANGKNPSKPDPKEHILMALLRGEPLKVKPQAEIIELCRKKIAEEHYGSRSIPIAELFASCPKHAEDIKEWTASCKDREQRLKAYTKEADRILRLAELDPDSDASDVSDKLAEVAAKHGLA